VLGFRFEAYKTTRAGYDMMQQLKVPAAWQEEIDLANLKCRSKPFADKDSQQVICNRCMAQNSLVNPDGDFCTKCGNPFIRNLVGFDTLPLVEFVPPSDMPHKRVLECLRADPPEEGRKKLAGGSGFGGNNWQNNGQE
jgi:hypothetical protein